MKSNLRVIVHPRCIVRAAIVLILLAFALCRPNLEAQVGNNNPGGVSGIFNGQVTTGCAYDPFTGNASRSVTDIVVAGAVGEYPLALVRTANSRTPSFTEWFGYAGGWNHNYNWAMEDSTRGNAQNFRPARYTVSFPDGRVETFRAVTWDAGVYRVRPGPDTPAQNSSSGVRERLLPINPPNNMYAYLFLPDGGKVKFQATQHSVNGQFYYKYKAAAIIDPHGLETTFTYEIVGNGLRRLTRVTEPAGRYLQFSYATTSGPRISQITEYISGIARRTVQYYYTYRMLDRVVYYGIASWTARYQYTAANTNGDLPPLLLSCDDPMYVGPMKRIAYEYKPGRVNDPSNPDGTTPVYGQILRERYWDGNLGNELNGPIVSELTVGTGNPVNHNVRIEKRANDINQTRKFTYDGAGYITWVHDFMNHATSQSYDSYHWINSVTDRNNHTINYTCDPITGNITQIRFPLTPGDTQGQGNTRPTVNYTYTNNYFLHTVQDEGGNLTTISYDANNSRITRVDYPDGGYETFSYDPAPFYQVTSHRLKTGGNETFAYDGQHRLQHYSDPYHNNTSNPSKTYRYDDLHRVSEIEDALNHSVNFDYNDRGQVTVATLPWINGVRYTVNNVYNPNGDGTLLSTEDPLNHTTTYAYDDYRRLKSVTPPVRGAGDNGVYTTYFYYGANASDELNDYKFADSNMTWIKLPSGKRAKNVYDENRRKTSMSVGYGTADEATTEYSYDSADHLRTISNPQPGHVNLTVNYDERNRPYQVIVGPFQTTTINYDAAGRRKTIQRPNGQTVTFDAFDTMNRVVQQTVTYTPSPDAVTKFTYYTTADGPNAPVGLLKTMKDPRLAQLNNGQAYTYEYDLLGRKKKITYPKDGTNTNRTEQWAYDAVGRLDTFSNRANKVQTFDYDQLSRIIGFSWNDGGITPSVTFRYDEASRLTEIDNANASISRTYYNDNLLHTETQSLASIGGLDNRHVTYSYNEDGNRSSLAIPGYTFDYLYTGRNQVRFINDDATGLTQAYYEYDLDGNVTLRNVNTSPITASNFGYDAYDRVTSVSHTLNGTTRTWNYGYDNGSNNRLWAKRGMTPTSPENNKGEAFSYDLGNQAIAFQLNVANPQNVSQPLPRNIVYDANGNRTSFQSILYGAASNLNQYTTRTIVRNTTTAGYDVNGSMTTGLDGSTYTYDAQNRLLSATKNGVTMSFEYDGLNRQVSRTSNGTKTYSTWEGWNLVEEYTNNPAVIQARYLYGSSGLIKDLQNSRYYCQDGSGSTTLVTDGTGHLLEWYRYDLQGTPLFYASNDTQRNPNQSSFGVRHLFTGQQWCQDLGLYDLRNRFYSPDVGRFLQPDPIGFRAGNNLYRYCGNNPVTRWDPLGFQGTPQKVPDGAGSNGGTATLDRVIVDAPDVPEPIEPIEPIDPGGTGAPSGGGGGGGPAEGGGGGPKLSGITFSYGKPPQNSNSNTQQQPPGVMVGFDIYHPATIAEFIIAGNIMEHGDTTDTTPAIDPVDFFSWGIAGLLRTSARTAAANVVNTPYGRALQSTTTEALAALRQIRDGATVYKGGVLGRSQTTASQFLSLENPLNPGYAGRYGIPPANSSFNFILSGRVQPGAPLITRPAAGVAPTLKPGMEGVTTPGSFILDSFYMPD